MKRNNQKRAFTIVELVIVIAVIAILAAVLIPTYTNLVKKANAATALSDAKNFITEMLADILSGGDNASDIVIVTKKGNDAYIHGYDASAGQLIAYKDNPVALESGDDFYAQAKATCDNLGVFDTQEEWITKDKLDSMITAFGFKTSEMAVFSCYSMKKSFYGIEGVACIGNTGYPTLEAAFEAANASKGATIKLLDDCVLSSAISASGVSGEMYTYILDLNGKSITSDKNCFRVWWSNLVIRDTSKNSAGTITSNGSGMNTIQGQVRSNVTIEGGTVIATNQAVAVLCKGEFVMTGGTLIGAEVSNNHGTFGLNVEATTATSKITGGSINGIRFDGGAKLIIGEEGGDNSKVQITGELKKFSGNLSIKSGTFTSNSKITDFDSNSLTITGGSFANKPTVGIAQGYTATQQGAYWIISKSN